MLSLYPDMPGVEMLDELPNLTRKAREEESLIDNQKVSYISVLNDVLW